MPLPYDPSTARSLMEHATTAAPSSTTTDAGATPPAETTGRLQRHEIVERTLISFQTKLNIALATGRWYQASKYATDIADICKALATEKQNRG